MTDTTKLTGYAITGPADDGLSTTKIIAYSVMDDPTFVKVSQASIDVAATLESEVVLSNLHTEVLSAASFATEVFLSNIFLEIVRPNVAEVVVTSQPRTIVFIN